MWKLRSWVNPLKLDWRQLSRDPAAIAILEQYPEKINWLELSRNPAAIHLLEQNPDKINWDVLSENPAAIHLLEQNPDKVNWWWLTRNPAIFKYDYVRMKQAKRDLHEELVAERFHPRNMSRFDGWGFEAEW